MFRRRYMLALASCFALAACEAAPAAVPPDSPEAVADAFVDAYFRLADQEKAKPYTAFGASKMLDNELKDVRAVRSDGYGPKEANINVVCERGARTMRGAKVRFDYTLRYRTTNRGESLKHADIELAEVHGVWKVVRVGLTKEIPGKLPD